MLALIESGQVIFGAIYDFVNDKLYSAELGKGSTMNGTAIRVSDRSLRQAYVSYETHMEKSENLKTFQNLRNKSVLFTTACCGIEYTMIASGKLDGRVAFDPYGKDYDFAPGSLLVQEAGGVVANLGKTTYDYQNRDFIAANPIIFKELTEGPDAIFPIA
jgi:myo-inositol-1(or 4)-monophosphatase